MAEKNSVVRKITSGDIRAAAKLIGDIEAGIQGSREVLKELFPFTGKAYIIGITGPPGVGKSTLVDRMATHIRKDGKTVGVLAIDPSSPFSSGAILGDRIRMQNHSMDEGVFIRSMASRGQHGGLSRSTRSAIDVLDAMGKDYIIVETIGVGQGDIDIVKSAHTTVIVLIPGMGDSIQAIKSGILEIGDIYLINKSDREDSEKTLRDLSFMIRLNRKKYEHGLWEPPILKIEALSDKGITGFLEEVERHRKYLMKGGVPLGLRNNKDRVRDELKELVKNLLYENVIDRLVETEDFNEAVDAVLNRNVDPYSACDNLIRPLLKMTDL